MSEDLDLQSIVHKFTLINAAKYDGVAQVASVLSSLMGDRKDLRPQAREIKSLVEEEVEIVNKMSMEEIFSALEDLGVDTSAIGAKKVEQKGLPPLPGMDEATKPRFRMAPFPSGPLHIGNARMVVLNDEYCKLTGGTLVLCFDDTIGAMKKKIEEEDSGAKFVLPEAYDQIREGLTWFGVQWHEEVFKSDRLDIYYDYTSQLIEMDKAYVCTCDPESFKSLKDAKEACPHHDNSVDQNKEDWQKMLDGTFGEGEAVVRLKSGIDLADPALREPVIMRISEAEHPRVGSAYRVWPMLEFSWAIDDHLLGITHIIRGKDLFKEDFIEELIWDMFGWEKATILHYGIISFEGLKLSKTYAREQINKGEFLGWDDPRTWSLQSLAKRGIRPEALRATLLSMGLSMVDIDFPYSILYAENQKLIDPVSNRYFFVENPAVLSVSDIPSDGYTAEPLLNPLNKSLGTRSIAVSIEGGCKDLLISEMDRDAIQGLQGDVLVRLKDLFNVTITDGDLTKGRFHSKEMETARAADAKIVHWVDSDPANSIDVEIMMPDGTMLHGKGEVNLTSVDAGQTLQFERFGFVRVTENSSGTLHAWLAHLSR
jgi:glutamyl-tRNA synthetase